MPLEQEIFDRILKQKKLEMVSKKMTKNRYIFVYKTYYERIYNEFISSS